VLFSKQWGMQTSWLLQAAVGGAPGSSMRYWRAVASRLLLHEVYDFERDQDLFACGYWAAVDWVGVYTDETTYVPYWNNPTVKTEPTVLVTTYLHPQRAMFMVSNQGKEDAVVNVTLQEPLNGFKYFLDSETAEEITQDGARLSLFIPHDDYRFVLASNEPFDWAAKNLFEGEDIPPQSHIDPRPTVTAMCRGLMTSIDPVTVEGGHRLTELQMQAIVDSFRTRDQEYLDAEACKKYDLGADGVQMAMINDYGRVLIVYYNDTDTPMMLSGRVRAPYAPHHYIINALSGVADWAYIDLPPRQGRIEINWGDAPDFWRLRKAGLRFGTQQSRMLEAIRGPKEQ